LPAGFDRSEVAALGVFGLFSFRHFSNSAAVACAPFTALEREE